MWDFETMSEDIKGVVGGNVGLVVYPWLFSGKLS